MSLRDLILQAVRTVFEDPSSSPGRVDRAAQIILRAF